MAKFWIFLWKTLLYKTGTHFAWTSACFAWTDISHAVTWGVPRVVFCATAVSGCVEWVWVLRHWPVSPQSPITDPAAAKPSSQQSQVPPVHHCGVYSCFTSSVHTVHYYSVYYRSMRYLRGTFRREQTGAIKVKFCLQKPCLVLPVLREEALLPEEKWYWTVLLSVLY